MGTLARNYKKKRIYTCRRARAEVLRGGSAREEGKKRGEGRKCEKIGAREAKASLRGRRCCRFSSVLLFSLLLLLLLLLFSFTLYFVARPFARRTCMCEIRGVEASEPVHAPSACMFPAGGREGRGERGEKRKKKKKP